MSNPAELAPDEELVLAVFRYFRRIRREQPSQLWLNEQFTSLKTEIQKMVTQADFDAAGNAGATPEQLQALTDLHASLSAKNAELAAAALAGTPAAPTP